LTEKKPDATLPSKPEAPRPCMIYSWQENLNRENLDMKKLQNVTLELSGKAFTDDTDATMVAVCRRMFTQWLPLLTAADGVSVLLWIADGSEILEYTGRLDDTFEWAYWCGCANPIPAPAGWSERQRRNTHCFPQKYRPDAAPRSYDWLRRLIATLRRVGTEITGQPIRIGATFDNGPEFAISPFKFRKHREIAQGHTIYPHSFVVCTAELHADQQAYAAYPDGIPEGTSLGEFLGRQFRAFKADLGYDYIWLSNGMGFGRETWGITGALFDKQTFRPEAADEAADAMLRFWQDFTAACPGLEIETRGSNFSAGTELATDACPLRELYRDYRIAPPVNSPWAALNFNTGLELAAWMSHVAELPDARFPFRFYTHDPWFMNSPWLDRYGREPWDIYLPLSVGRINAAGAVETANRMAILSVDDTCGRMPDQVPQEVIPHLLSARRQAPDAPGPLLWVYPFDEYSELVRGSVRRPDVVFAEDQFLGEAVQEGLPLNTVVSTGNFRRLAASRPEKLGNAILLIPTSALLFAENRTAVKQRLDGGGSVMLYGTLSGLPSEVWDWLQLRPATPIEGRVAVESTLPGDEFRSGRIASEVDVLPQFTGGGLTEAAADDDPGVLAWASQAGERRVLARYRDWPSGAGLGFVRTMLPCVSPVSPGSQLDLQPPDRSFPTARLPRWLLERFGWRLRNRAFGVETLLPRTCISRHEQAFFWSVFARDTTAELHLRTPLGAPVFTEVETLLEDGDAVVHPDKFWRKECRCLVRQTASSVVGCTIVFAAYPCYTDRRHYTGLRDAEVWFFPPSGVEDRLEITSPEPGDGNLLAEPLLTPEWVDTPYGRGVRLTHRNGNLNFAW